MDYLVIHDVLDKIIFYLKDVDLYQLMTTCKYMRNTIGTSDVWKGVNCCRDLTGIAEFVDVEKVFELFSSIKLNTRSFAIRDYYSTWYYLYVLKSWINRDNGYWNVYSLVNNLPDITKLCQVNGFTLENCTEQYRDWSMLLPDVAEKLLKVNDEDWDKILRMIYIDIYGYSYDDCGCRMIITNTKMTRGYRKHFGWYPIQPCSHERENVIIDSNHFYYTLTYKYNSCDCHPAKCKIGKNGEKNVEILPVDFSEKILDISMELDVEYETLFQIIVILLEKFGYQCTASVKRFIAMSDPGFNNDKFYESDIEEDQFDDDESDTEEIEEIEEIEATDH
jgi:hypothetical protein